MVSSKRQRIDRAAVAEDDLLLPAIEIQARTTRAPACSCAGHGRVLVRLRRWKRCSSLSKRPRAHSGLRSPRGVGLRAARGSSRASCCRSSPAARWAARGPAAAPASRSRCSRCGRPRRPAPVPRRRGGPPPRPPGRPRRRRNWPSRRGSSAARDRASPARRPRPGRGRRRCESVRLMRIAPGFPAPGRG